MTITPSDALDLRIAQGPPASNLGEQIANIPTAYFQGLDEAYKRRTQDAFKNGVPTVNDVPNGEPDWKRINSTIIQQGGTGPALEASKVGQQQELIRGLQTMGGQVFGDGQPPPTTMPPQSPQVTPQSLPQRAPPMNRVSGGDNGQTIMGAVTSLFGGESAGRVSMAVSKRLGIDPNAPLPPDKFAQVQQYVQSVAGARPQPAPSGPNPAASPEGVASVTNDPTLGGLIPKGQTVESHLQRLRQAATLAASTGIRNAEKPYLDAVDAIQKRLQPTETEKNYLANKLPGETQPAYEARIEGSKESAKKFAAIPAETFDNARKGNEAAQAAKYRLDLIDHSILELGPKWMGSGAGTRFEIAKGINTALDSILPKELADRVKFDPNKIANVEDFNKQTQTLGFELAKTLGSREAMQIVQQATNSVPNFNQSPLGAKLVSGSLRQASQRQEDFYKYIAKPENRERLGAEIDFNQKNPPAMYSTRAIAASGIPVPISGGQQQVDWLPKGTKFIWNGKPWTKQ